jgi:hypothetical protein
MLKVMLCSLSIVLGAGLLFAHGDATHLMGTVSSIDTAKNIFVIKQADGKSVSVMTDKFTKYLKSDKPTPSSDLKVGVRVVIDAKMDKTAKMFVAEEVRLGVAAPAAAAAKTAGATKTTPQKAAPSKQ